MSGTPMWISRKRAAAKPAAAIEVTCAVVVEDNRILAVQRSDGMPHPGKWEFPGGKLKEGETPEGCIRREIREELGVEIAVERLLPSVNHRYEKQTIKLIPFICTIREGTIMLSEHQEFRWIPCGEMEMMDWLDADVEVVGMVKERLC